MAKSNVTVPMQIPWAAEVPLIEAGNKGYTIEEQNIQYLYKIIVSNDEVLNL